MFLSLADYIGQIYFQLTFFYKLTERDANTIICVSMDDIKIHRQTNTAPRLMAHMALIDYRYAIESAPYVHNDKWYHCQICDSVFYNNEHWEDGWCIKCDAPSLSDITINEYLS